MLWVQFQVRFGYAGLKNGLLGVLARAGAFDLEIRNKSNPCCGLQVP
jgi:hypothetical protein